MSDLPQIPSAWEDYRPLITKLVRHALGAAGGAGLGWANGVTGSQVEMAVSLIMIAASGLWSLWQGVATKRALRVAAANPAGMPPPRVPS